jgi:hypothetical protein
VLDLYRIFKLLFLRAIQENPLVYKAPDSAGAIYQQSYPQKPWKTLKAFLNQGLSSMFLNVS